MTHSNTNKKMRAVVYDVGTPSLLRNKRVSTKAVNSCKKYYSGVEIPIDGLRFSRPPRSVLRKCREKCAFNVDSQYFEKHLRRSKSGLCKSEGESLEILKRKSEVEHAAEGIKNMEIAKKKKSKPYEKSKLKDYTGYETV